MCTNTLGYDSDILSDVLGWSHFWKQNKNWTKQLNSSIKHAKTLIYGAVLHITIYCELLSIHNASEYKWQALSSGTVLLSMCLDVLRESGGCSCWWQTCGRSLSLSEGLGHCCCCVEKKSSQETHSLELGPLAEKKTSLNFSMRERPCAGLQDTVHLCSESSRHSESFFSLPAWFKCSHRFHSYWNDLITCGTMDSKPTVTHIDSQDWIYGHLYIHTVCLCVYLKSANSVLSYYHLSLVLNYY